MVKEKNKTGIDRQRKRTFLIFTSVLAFVTLLVFMYFDFKAGAIEEIYLDIFMCLAIVIGNICVFKFNLDRISYCIFINIVNLILIYDVSIGAGGEGGLFWLPIMPLLIFFFFEKIEAVLSAAVFFCCAMILLTYPSLFDTYPYELNLGLKYLMSLFFVIIIAYGLESSRYRYSELLKQANIELQSHKEQLETALSEVNTLSGLLPICSHCKKIRDDKGYWNQIESYLKEHSEAEFTHGMCPDCMDKLYHKEKWYIEMKKGKQ